MDYLDNDYLIPTILGGGKQASLAAAVIHERLRLRPYLFATRFSLYQRLFCKCRRIPEGELTALLRLCDLADGIAPEYSPLLIFTREYGDFVLKHSHEIESRYVAVAADVIVNSRKDS